MFEIIPKTRDCLTKKGCKPYVNLFVRVTDMCHDNCPFCAFKSGDKSCFSLSFLAYILSVIDKKKIRINRISFTGGEPALYSSKVEEACEYIRLYDSSIPIIVNTRKGMLLPPHLVDSISISRHSEKDPSIKEFVEHYGKDKIHVSCVLQKGIVDTQDRIKEFMCHYEKQGAVDFGFVELMKTNEYAKDHFVEFKAPSSYRQYSSLSMTGCTCANYVSDKYPFSTLYYRGVKPNCDSNGLYVLDVNCLRHGFGGDTICTEGGKA